MNCLRMFAWNESVDGLVIAPNLLEFKGISERATIELN